MAAMSESRARGARPAVEDVPVRALERLQRSQPAAAEERDGATHAAAEAAPELLARAEQRPRPVGLVAQQHLELRARLVELRHAEARPLLGRQVDPPEREVARDVLQEVDQLQAGADVVRERDQLGIVRAAEDAEHEPADRIGRVDAVVLEVGPGRVLRDPLVHPVRLDQAEKRLARERAGTDRRLQDAHHRPGRLALVASVDLALELVEDLRPVAFVLVTEDVDETRKAVDRPQVRANRPREEKRRDGEVLRPRSCGNCVDRSRVHAETMARRDRSTSNGYREGRTRGRWAPAVRQTCVSEVPAASPRLEASPAGSSSTALEPRQAAIRHGGSDATTLSTRSLESRKTTSIGKRMKAVWTEAAGRSSSPSPAGKLLRPEQPAHAGERCLREEAPLADDRSVVIRKRDLRKSTH